MGWFLAVVMIILTITLIMILRVTVTVQYTYQGGRHELKVNTSILFGLINIEIPVPDLMVKTNPPTVSVKGKNDEEIIPPEEWLDKIKNLKDLKDKIIQTHEIFRGFLKGVTIRKFEWRTAAGTGDAAMTGMITGTIWALKGSMMKLIAEHIKLKGEPIIDVAPYFQFRIAATSLTCMFSFRAGKAIAAGIRLYKYLKLEDRQQGSNGMPALSSEEGQSY
ncbi:DUF2953 domain-containing protein [Neobacillus notoginsengisoli]|uniref:DUF2953 domain-containing protein n=1 Tax=Neobacillus notoginsengisoli TaxID=1578198 RepID=A0A417YUD6_9BACI|nr:DUF2953 domain-containing protein [Neobacillus notoginsengisoli]RHW40752.1 DUF2953 domain-containing protein [Neobacillus notoginsengisoli]